MKYQNTIQKAGLIVGSVLLSLFIAELALRLVYPENRKLYVWQPNLQHTFYPDSTIFYGVHGKKKFTINSQGFRGEEFQKDGKQKYLCLGGSTTECLYLDDRETWFQSLGFGSIGKSGSTTREHYIQLKYFVPQLGKIDGVVLMVGLNDMMKRLSRDSLFENNFRFTPALEDSFINQTLISTAKELGRWRKSRVIRAFLTFLHQTKKVEWENVQDDNGNIYKAWRENRQHTSKIIDSLPDLSSGLSEFERNLRLIYDETQKQKIKLVLINQATLYKDSMNEFETNLLWMGGVGDFQAEKNQAYYSTRVLNQAMQLYNERMKNFCSTQPQVKCIDLASQLPKDTSVFYDDCHFNESGARKVIDIISKSFSDSSK